MHGGGHDEARWQQPVHSTEDLVRLGLVDLPGLHDFWVETTLSTYLAMAQRYPLGDFGARRIIDVDYRGPRRPAATFLRSYRGALRPYIALSRSTYGHRTDPAATVQARHYDTHNGLGTTGPDSRRHELVHEMSHGLLDLGMGSLGFTEELSRAVTDALGVAWTPERHGDPAVQQRVHAQCGRFATTNVEEFVAEALTQGILHGDRASPTGKAVLGVVDRRYRFDAPGSQRLAELVRTEYETAHHGPPPDRLLHPWRPKRLWDLPEWEPLERAWEAGARLRSPVWLPLNVSGRVDEAPLAVHLPSHRDRTQPREPARPGQPASDLNDALACRPSISRSGLLAGASASPAVCHRAVSAQRVQADVDTRSARSMRHLASLSPSRGT